MHDERPVFRASIGEIVGAWLRVWTPRRDVYIPPVPPKPGDPPLPPQPPWKPPRMGVGGSTQLRLSTLEIQPGAQEVTQMTVGTSSEMLQMLYSIPLTVDQHTCRHVDPASCP